MRFRQEEGRREEEKGWTRSGALANSWHGIRLPMTFLCCILQVRGPSWRSFLFSAQRSRFYKEGREGGRYRHV